MTKPYKGISKEKKKTICCWHINKCWYFVPRCERMDQVQSDEGPEEPFLPTREQHRSVHATHQDPGSALLDGGMSRA